MGGGEGGKDPLFWVSIFTCTCPQLILLVGVAANPKFSREHSSFYTFGARTSIFEFFKNENWKNMN